MYNHICLGKKPRDCFAVAMTLMYAIFYTIVFSDTCAMYDRYNLYKPLIHKIHL